MRAPIPLLSLALLSLGACHSPSKNVVTPKDDLGGTRKVVDGLGSQGTFRLPKIQVNANDFDLDGVHLYPGSRIANLSIVGHDADGREKPLGNVKVRFDSPSPPATVRDWFETKLANDGRTMHRDGTGLSGTAENGQPFRLQLGPAGAGHSDGTITIGD